MNKKATTFNTLMWIFKIFFLVIVLFTVVLLVRSFIVTELDVFNAEADIFMQRVIMSRNGISYYDSDIDRLYPGIIDMTKFGKLNEILNSSISYGDENSKIAANFILVDEKNTTVAAAVFNPYFYERWKQMLNAQWIKGPGGVKSTTKQISVLIKGNELKKGILITEIIIPNS
jgi:hypothetical protein